MILLALACKGEDSTPPPDSEPEPRIELPLSTALPPGAGAVDATLAAVHLRWGDGPTLGDSLDPADLPELPPEEHFQPAARDWPELEAAFYLLMAFEDADGDGAWTEGETVLGGDLERLLVQLRGEGPEGWPVGSWALVDTGLSGQYQPNRCHLDSTEPLLWREEAGYPVFTELEPRTLLLRGAPAPLRLAGTAAAGRVQGVSWQQANGEDGFEPVFDVGVEDGAWSATLEAPPPDSHIVNSDPDWGYTLHYLLHADPEGTWSGDTACVQGQLSWARWTRPIHSFRGLRLLECYDGTVGWRLAQNEPESSALVYLPAESGAALALGPCP